MKDRKQGKNKTITLDNGATAIEVKKRNAEIIHYKIDKQDVKKVRKHWWFSHNGYCCTMRNDRFWYLHWELMGKPRKGYVLYFLDGNRKNNLKSNLKKLTWRQRNLLLLYKREPNSSTGVIGVSRYGNRLYVVAIGSGNKRRSFRTPVRDVGNLGNFRPTNPFSRNHRQISRIKLSPDKNERRLN